MTGASSGIGLAFARLLAQDGYDLLLAARDKKQLENVAAELHSEYGAKSDIVALDLSLDKSADTVWDLAKQRKVSVLINNAGFGDLKPLLGANWEKLENMISLNISALTRLSQLAAQTMKQEGNGKILNVASTAAFLPGPGMATYYATKAYVLSFSEAIAEELRGSGVTVTALCPGPTKTHFADTAGANGSMLFKGNLPTADEVAEYGYQSLKEGKIVAVHGMRNKIIALVVPRLLPRWAVRRIVNKTMN